MVKRYELSDAQWRRIEGLLPGKPGDPGRTAQDNRLFVNGVLWVLRNDTNVGNKGTLARHDPSVALHLTFL